MFVLRKFRKMTLETFQTSRDFASAVVAQSPQGDLVIIASPTPYFVGYKFPFVEGSLRIETKPRGVRSLVAAVFSQSPQTSTSSKAHVRYLPMRYRVIEPSLLPPRQPVDVLVLT